MDYTSISKQLKTLGPDRKISESTAVGYIQTLRLGIIKGDDLNTIVLLTKLLDFVPKSDAIFALFDSAFIHKLFLLANDPKLSSGVFRSILRIWLTYLAGVLPVTRTRGMFNTLLASLCGQIGSSDSLVNHLVKNITLSDTRMNLNVVDFVAKVLYRIVESINSVATNSNTFIEEEKWLFCFLRSLYNNDFFGALSASNGIDEIEKMTGLRGSMELVNKWVNEKVVTYDSIYWNECVTLASEVGITLEIHESKKLLHVLIITGVLSSPKKALFKTLVECSMQEPFPLLQFVKHLTLLITNEPRLKPIFPFWNTELWYSLLNVSARSWLFSGATSNSGDDMVVIKFSKVMISWLADQLISCKNNENIPLLLDDISNFKYEDLKKVQLRYLNETIADNWQNEMKGFKKMLDEEVVSFVKNEIFMGLSKGCWVYSDNPLNSPHYTGNWYFITLSPNSKSIIYKEYSARLGHSKYPGVATITTSPNIDKDGVQIELKSILSVHSEDLTVEKNQLPILTITSQRMIVNKIEIIAGGSNVSFYVNTVQLKEIWDDGLNMLLNDSKTSTHVLNQIHQLKHIATRTQLLPLEATPTPDLSDSTKEWDFSTLNTNFYYY